MQLSILSEPSLDPTSVGDRWFATLCLKTTKKGYDDLEFWRSDRSYESEATAESEGRWRLATYLSKVMK